MDMNYDQCVRSLRGIKADQQRYYKAAQSKRRRMSPAERAMTLAHYQMNIDALTYAIERMTLTLPLETQLKEVITDGEAGKN